MFLIFGCPHSSSSWHPLRQHLIGESKVWDVAKKLDQYVSNVMFRDALENLQVKMLIVSLHITTSKNFHFIKYKPEHTKKK